MASEITTNSQTRRLHDRTKIQQQNLRKTWHQVTQTFWMVKTGLGFLALSFGHFQHDYFNFLF